jgi:hypothetical protein
MNTNYHIKQTHSDIIENIFELRKEYENIISDLENQLKLHIGNQIEAKQKSEKLWKLLDDIDSASDMFKPSKTNGFESYENFYRYSIRKSMERFEIYGSDGYNLIEPKSKNSSTEEFGRLPRYIDESKDIKECYPTSESPILENNIG